MATVRGLETRAVKAPLARPHRTASGTVEDALLVLIDIDCGDVVGRSYVFVYSPAAVASTVSLVDAIGHLLVGQRLEPARIHDDLQAQFRILGTTGLVGYALGGIDMALWDALAISLDAPLWRVLGGTAKSIPIYESMGMMSPEETRAEAETAAASGVTAFKVKAGHPDPAHDRSVGEALREVAGAEGDMMFDYNQAFTPYEASQRLARLVDLELAWIEEPVAADDLAGHAQVRRSTPIPVQTGENLWNAAQLERVLMAGATDLVMLDACRIGLTGWLRAAAVAEAHATPLSTHFYPELSIHAMSVTPTAHYVEWLDVSSSILENPLQPLSGTITPNDEPGTGIVWNQAALDRYTI